MQNIYGAAEQLKAIGVRYGLTMKQIDALEDQRTNEKICVPVIGLFSSGKSSLLNALLDYGADILAVDITAETAVPAELEFVENMPERPVQICYKSGKIRHCTLREYVGHEFAINADDIKNVHLALDSNNLGQFPDIQLVDMPGFESGIEAHNRSIDGYVEKSMAYLITFAADGDMTLKESVGSILKELCQFDMPLIVVITKCDKVDDRRDFEAKKESLKESLRGYIGNRALGWCETSSQDGEIRSLQNELKNLQNRAEELRLKKFCALLRPEANIVRDYLRTRLSGLSLSESELLLQETELQEKISVQETQLADSTHEFESKISVCVANIRNAVQHALNSAEGNIVDKVMCGQQHSVGDYLNSVVREALSRGIETYYIPLVQKYIKDASSSGLGADPNVNVAMAGIDLEKRSIAGPVLGGVAAALLIPGVGILALIAGGVIAIANKLRNESKKKEAENRIRSWLNSEAFPTTIRQVEDQFRRELERHSQQVIETIIAQGNAQKAALEQSLEALRTDIQKEQTQREQDTKVIQADLDQVEAIINEL